MQNAKLDEAQTVIKIAERNVNSFRYIDDTNPKAKSEDELKGLLMKVKEMSEKVGLKLYIKKTKIMVSGPITSRQVDGEKNGNSDRLYLFFCGQVGEAPKSLQIVTAAMKLKEACSFEEKLWQT